MHSFISIEHESRGYDQRFDHFLLHPFPLSSRHVFYARSRLSPSPPPLFLRALCRLTTATSPSPLFSLFSLLPPPPRPQISSSGEASAKVEARRGKERKSPKSLNPGSGESPLALAPLRSTPLVLPRGDELPLPSFMAAVSRLLLLALLLALVAPRAIGTLRLHEGGERFSILNYESLWHDYTPPSPPPSPPDPPSASCEDDLGGTGDFDTLCEVHSSVLLSGDIFVKEKGSFVLYADVVLSCPVPGCSVIVNLTGEIRIGRNAKIVAGKVQMEAGNMSLADGAAINTTALAGDPPPQTSGAPSGTNGDGGGHGGRGASCVVKDGQTQEDSWGGDAYSWSTLTKPVSYGSKGGSTSREKDYGGGGGGQIYLVVKDFLEVNGSIMADGGEGGSLGGGGSGGSIYVNATKM